MINQFIHINNIGWIFQAVSIFVDFLKIFEMLICVYPSQIRQNLQEHFFDWLGVLWSIFAICWSLAWITNLRQTNLPAEQAPNKYFDSFHWWLYYRLHIKITICCVWYERVKVLILGAKFSQSRPTIKVSAAFGVIYVAMFAIPSVSRVHQCNDIALVPFFFFLYRKI